MTIRKTNLYINACKSSAVIHEYIDLSMTTWGYLVLTGGVVEAARQADTKGMAESQSVPRFV